MKKLNLKTKVLLPVAIMVLVVIVGALFVVNQVVRRQVFVMVSQELHRSVKVFEEFQAKELNLLRERSWVISEVPQLKAAVDTGDSTTVQRVADKIFKTLGSDVLLVTDRRSRILSQNGFSARELENLQLDTRLGSPNVMRDTTAVLTGMGSVYQLLSVPILTGDDISDVFILGRVIAGTRIDSDYLKKAKGLVECEIALTPEDGVVATTLPVALLKSRPALLEAGPGNGERGIFPVELNDEDFIATQTVDHYFVLFKSVEQAFVRIMRPIEQTMVVIGCFAILAALLISSFVSYGIVTPVQKLVRATEEITSGDYEHRLDVQSGDEIGRLTAKFDEMRETLRQKMAQLHERNTELEQALQQLEAAQKELVRTERLAATGKITAQLSHELNNPIHNIQSCIEAARKKIDGGESGGEFVDLAHEEILRIGKLTRQMLDSYRPLAHGKQDVDVNSLLKSLLKSSEWTGQNGSFEVRKELNFTSGSVVASEDQLKQVFLNLFLNARDAMPDGGTLLVKTEQKRNDLLITFRDSGCGIPAENLDKIFEAFFTTKAEANGVGLGLSVSYGIIQGHGGDIQVESEVGKGSIFTVSLPLSE